VLLLLVLWLLEGACAITPLPTNSARIGKARKSETKGGATYLGAGFKALSLFLFFSLIETQEEAVEDS